MSKLQVGLRTALSFYTVLLFFIIATRESFRAGGG